MQLDAIKGSISSTLCAGKLSMNIKAPTHNCGGRKCSMAVK
jgi:hypothetical protein